MVEAPRGVRNSARRAALYGGILAALAISGALVFVLRTHRGQGPSEAPTTKPRPTVAVIGFRDASPQVERSWVSAALSELMTAELSAAPQLRTISSANVARMKVDLALPDTDSLSAETLARIHTNIGSDLIVVGSYLALGEESDGRLRISARVLDATSGASLVSSTEDGVEQEIVDLASRVAGQIRGKIAGGRLSSQDRRRWRAALPTTAESARLYAEGLARMRLFDFLAARGLLERAVAVDPQFSLAHAALADANAELGYAATALEESRKAHEWSRDLPEEIRLRVEADYLDRTGDVEGEMMALRQLTEAYPDDLDYGISLANALAKAGRIDEAYAMLDRLHKLPFPARDDPRIDLAEAWYSDADAKRKLKAAVRAAARAEERGARSLIDDALTAQGLAFEWLGEVNKAAFAYDRARQIRTVIGDRWGVAKVSSMLGNLLSRTGDLGGARRFLQQSIDIHREMGGNRQYLAEALARMGDVVLDLGDHATARKLYNDSYRISRESESGVMSGCTFQPDNARCCLAELDSTEGDLAGARRIIDDVMAHARGRDDRGLIAEASSVLGHILKDQGELKGAVRALQEARTIWTERGQGALVNKTDLLLALVALEDARFTEAESLAQQVARTTQAGKNRPLEAAATAVVARTMFAAGNSPGALEAARHAESLGASAESPFNRLFVVVTIGRGRVESGEASVPEDCAQSLEAALREAKKIGLVGLTLEARLALNELDAKQGKAAQAHSRLAALAREAQTKGFGLIAERARRFR